MSEYIQFLEANFFPPNFLRPMKFLALVPLMLTLLCCMFNFLAARFKDVYPQLAIEGPGPLYLTT